MKNFVQEGGSLEVTMPYQRNSGEGVQVGAALFGVAAATYANSATGVICTCGVFDIAKAAGAISAGARVFWDNSAKNLTTTATSNLCVGVATQAAASGDATARIKLGASTPAGT